MSLAMHSILYLALQHRIILHRHKEGDLIIDIETDSLGDVLRIDLKA
jgi:hypothetical protein